MQYKTEEAKYIFDFFMNSEKIELTMEDVALFIGMHESDKRKHTGDMFLYMIYENKDEIIPFLNEQFIKSKSVPSTEMQRNAYDTKQQIKKRGYEGHKKWLDNIDCLNDDYSNEEYIDQMSYDILDSLWKAVEDKFLTLRHELTLKNSELNLIIKSEFHPRTMRCELDFSVPGGCNIYSFGGEPALKKGLDDTFNTPSKRWGDLVIEYDSNTHTMKLGEKDDDIVIKGEDLKQFQKWYKSVLRDESDFDNFITSVKRELKLKDIFEQTN